MDWSCVECLAITLCGGLEWLVNHYEIDDNDGYGEELKKNKKATIK